MVKSSLLLLLGAGLLSSSVFGALREGRRRLKGKSGSLHPDHDDKEDCNKAKIYVEFDNECASSKKQVKKNYKNLVNDYPECLYDDKHKHKSNIYYIESTDSWHGYIYLVHEGCEDNITLSYDDYCIEDFDYEPVYSLDVTCSSESAYLGSTSLYHTDIIDGSDDNTYNYVSGGSNYIDLYILDTGVLSTHNEFTHTNVYHLDSSFGDGSIAGYHGTHVAGIAGGKNVGTFKHAANIYEYPACRSGSSCSGQDIEDSLTYTISKLGESSRRGVINMSFGGLGSSASKSWYENYFSQMINNGGIPVSSAGNSADEVCRSDGYYYTPNSADNCISVGSYDSSLSVSWFSNYGECVDVYGPGSSVYSATHYSDSSYTYASGTSMSGPAVAGLVANLLYVNDDLTFDEIKSIVSSWSYATALNSCPNDSSDGNCNGIGMTCNEIISAAGGDSGSDSDDSSDGCSEEPSSSKWRCSESCDCEIWDSWRNDNYCDCPNCEDEETTGWNCNNCDCPDCSGWTYCGSSRRRMEDDTEDDSDNEYFTCDDGCSQVLMKYVNDGSYCDCTDCSDEDEWTCDSCVGGCPSECDVDSYSYCWQQSSSNSIDDMDAHYDSITSGTGSHCGCPGNNEEYDTITLSNLNPAIHGNSQVYDFNGEWSLVSGCINSASFFIKEIENEIFNGTENFILYFNGGGWVIGKESNINAYWAGCPSIDLFECDGLFWIHGHNGNDGDSSASANDQLTNECGVSTVDDSSSSLSVQLYTSETGEDNSDGGSSSGSSNSNKNDDDLEGWAWLLIGASIIIAIIAIASIYACACKNYKVVNQDKVGYNPNSYNLMHD